MEGLDSTCRPSEEQWARNRTLYRNRNIDITVAPKDHTGDTFRAETWPQRFQIALVGKYETFWSIVNHRGGHFDRVSVSSWAVVWAGPKTKQASAQSADSLWHILNTIWCLCLALKGNLCTMFTFTCWTSYCERSKGEPGFDYPAIKIIQKIKGSVFYI